MTMYCKSDATSSVVFVGIVFMLLLHKPLVHGLPDGSTQVVKADTWQLCLFENGVEPFRQLMRVERLTVTIGKDQAKVGPGETSFPLNFHLVQTVRIQQQDNIRRERDRPGTALGFRV